MNMKNKNLFASQPASYYLLFSNNNYVQKGDGDE